MRTIIRNVTILNGHKDMTPYISDVVIENGVFKEIKENADITSAKVIDGTGKYMVPGLINMHVHLPGSGMPKDTKKQNKESVEKLMKNPITRYIVYKLCAGFAKTELMSGVTTIRTVGGVQTIDTTIKKNQVAGKTIAPRILASNMGVTVEGGHMGGTVAYEAKSIEDALQFIEREAKDGIDLVKLMITGGVLDATKRGQPGELRMNADYVKACCSRAHELGYKVAAHVESKEGVRIALENGVDTIEHGAAPDDYIIELFKKTGSANICTLSCAVPFSLHDEKLKVTELQEYNGAVVMEGIIACAKSCLENSIPVGLGTDTACPFVTHYDMWRELCYFERLCGVTKSFALYTATLGNAEIAGISKVTGSIDVSKSADFILVDRNPLEDLSVLRKPYMVALEGKLYKKPKVKKFAYVEEALDRYLGLTA